MTYSLRLLYGAACAWLRALENNLNRVLGPVLCPRRYN